MIDLIQYLILYIVMGIAFSLYMHGQLSNSVSYKIKDPGGKRLVPASIVAGVTWPIWLIAIILIKALS